MVGYLYVLPDGELYVGDGVHGYEPLHWGTADGRLREKVSVWLRWTAAGLLPALPARDVARWRYNILPVLTSHTSHCTQQTCLVILSLSRLLCGDFNMHCMVMKRWITLRVKLQRVKISGKRKSCSAKYAQNRKMVRKNCISLMKVDIMTIYTCCNTDNN